MNILLDILILIVGFAALIKGADMFVDGSSGLARTFRVPSVIIGLTIVAMGTSAPELAVSTSAAIQGSNEIAISNVVGSNMCNLLVVLGVCAVIKSMDVDSNIMKRDYPLSVGLTALLLAFAGGTAIFSGKLFHMEMEANAGIISRFAAIVLLIIFVSYIIYLIWDARKHPVDEENLPTMPVWKSLIFIIIGIACIIGGGQAVVFSAKEIARIVGMSETLIGLTIVAVGTSLPELVTSVVASKKGENGMAVGNVVGSNIFNILFILGVSAAIRPISVNAASGYDLMILLAVSILTLLLIGRSRRLSKKEGVFMVGVYVAYMVFAALR